MGYTLKNTFFEKMENCKNWHENRAMNLIFGSNDFSYDSGASGKHLLFLKKCQLYRILDPLLDTRDDAKTLPKGPQNFLEKLYF